MNLVRASVEGVLFSIVCATKHVNPIRHGNVPLLFSSVSYCRYTVMSGTPEKILEHLLDIVKLDTNGSDHIGSVLLSIIVHRKKILYSFNT